MSQLKDYLREEINKSRGFYYPVRSGFFRQAAVKHAATSKLHPNPEDEFCKPEIGPNYSIISDYERDYRSLNTNPSIEQIQAGGILEPLIVQKAMPDGYMIMNGHHRWAAAVHCGKRRLRIKVVNLTREEDIRSMLNKSRSDRRVTLDLDETVFCVGEETPREKPFRFPLNRFFKEPVKQGIPALFHYLNKQGYDIWVYSAKYYSIDYIRHLFGHRHVHLTGIVTGVDRKKTPDSDKMRTMNELVESKYRSTVHIDNEMIVCSFSDTKEYKERMLNISGPDWSRAVMDAIEDMAADKKAQ